MPDEVLLQVLFCFCVVFVTSNVGPKRKGKRTEVGAKADHTSEARVWKECP